MTSSDDAGSLNLCDYTVDMLYDYLPTTYLARAGHL